MTESSKQLSFVADADTLALIEDLKTHLKAPTTAAVFRKALAIAKLAADQAKGSNGIVAVRGKSQPQSEEVNLMLQG